MTPKTPAQLAAEINATIRTGIPGGITAPPVNVDLNDIVATYAAGFGNGVNASYFGAIGDAGRDECWGR